MWCGCNLHCRKESSIKRDTIAVYVDRTELGDNQTSHFVTAESREKFWKNDMPSWLLILLWILMNQQYFVFECQTHIPKMLFFIKTLIGYAERFSKTDLLADLDPEKVNYTESIYTSFEINRQLNMTVTGMYTDPWTSSSRASP